MGNVYSVQVGTDHGEKEISVYHNDIVLFDQPIDVLTTSAFVGSYEPTPRTLFSALKNCGISVRQLAEFPKIDLRELCNVWLSEETKSYGPDIRRIGCIELIGRGYYRKSAAEAEQNILTAIRAYFSMLDIASLCGIPMETVALPLLGSGDQRISPDLLLVPLLNECISFLKRNERVKRIFFIERSAEKAALIAQALQRSYRFQDSKGENLSEPAPKRQKYAFISYSSKDKNIADNLCAKLEQNNVRVWYAPRDVSGPFAQSIVQAIDAVTHFIVILSRNSLASQHVLNEIDLAFQHLPDNISIKPLRLDDAVFGPSFKYYLSRQHWMDATIPPLEKRLNEFVQDLVNNP